MLFKIPESFRIAGVKHAVELDPNLGLDYRLKGEATYGHRKVVLCSQQPIEEQRRAFLHEAIHHVDVLFDIRLRESQVIRLATGIAELIQQLEPDSAQELAGMIMERGHET